MYQRSDSARDPRLQQHQTGHAWTSKSACCLPYWMLRCLRSLTLTDLRDAAVVELLEQRLLAGAEEGRDGQLLVEELRCFLTAFTATREQKHLRASAPRPSEASRPRMLERSEMRWPYSPSTASSNGQVSSPATTPRASNRQSVSRSRCPLVCSRDPSGSHWSGSKESKDLIVDEASPVNPISAKQPEASQATMPHPPGGQALSPSEPEVPCSTAETPVMPSAACGMQGILEPRAPARGRRGRKSLRKDRFLTCPAMTVVKSDQEGQEQSALSEALSEDASPASQPEASEASAVPSRMQNLARNCRRHSSEGPKLRHFGDARRSILETIDQDIKTATAEADTAVEQVLATVAELERSQPGQQGRRGSQLGGRSSSKPSRFRSLVISARDNQRSRLDFADVRKVAAFAHSQAKLNKAERTLRDKTDALEGNFTNPWDNVEISRNCAEVTMSRIQTASRQLWQRFMHWAGPVADDLRSATEARVPTPLERAIGTARRLMGASTLIGAKGMAAIEDAGLGLECDEMEPLDPWAETGGLYKVPPWEEVVCVACEVLADIRESP